MSLATGIELFVWYAVRPHPLRRKDLRGLFCPLSRLSLVTTCWFLCEIRKLQECMKSLLCGMYGPCSRSIDGSGDSFVAHMVELALESSVVSGADRPRWALYAWCAPRTALILICWQMSVLLDIA